ncbi:hypothetical protein KFO32_10840 [Pantoea ananatis]|uniref:hypothetical protein n=1 Tax=Pantoea ananas TaxID=553 RepID=UPI0015958150|nr:hypothetical protein [Pantoea ananatis]MCK0553547.1 hypothetical protein [Pantoea ananatis]MCW0312934.1 hypothetical protein [Pantoea ananatis]
MALEAVLAQRCEEKGAFGRCEGKDIAGGFCACLSLAGMSDRQAQIILFLVV